MRYVCVHGHFYQPPRENPWTGEIDDEPSAAPFPNWNARIAAECYEANGAARVGEASDEVQNNYAWMSFNFGATLLDWMARAKPALLESLRAADRASRRRWSAGNACAQGFHHAILPLCSPRDKVTEVRWGLDAFAHYFGRPARGLWLPEAAVDVATLEVLASLGVEFTILAPRQARGVRAPGQSATTPVNADTLDTRRAYRAALPSGRSIAVFFYDGPHSRSVAFDGALSNGERFGQGLVDAARRGEDGTLLHLATDGESYGHHHRFGDLALAYALRGVEGAGDVELTNYARYLRAHPPQWEVDIVEPSSWSCAHGVERWRSNCGCAADAGAVGHHGWRTALRVALDGLRDDLAAAYLVGLRELVEDPWALRDGAMASSYEGGDALRQHVASHASRALSDAEVERVMQHLRMQRSALAMFASCAWFFDDPGGIEPVNGLRNAARALSDYEMLTGRTDAGERWRRALVGLRRTTGSPLCRDEILRDRVYSARPASTSTASTIS